MFYIWDQYVSGTCREMFECIQYFTHSAVNIHITIFRTEYNWLHLLYILLVLISLLYIYIYITLVFFRLCFHWMGLFAIFSTALFYTTASALKKASYWNIFSTISLESLAIWHVKSIFQMIYIYFSKHIYFKDMILLNLFLKSWQ